MNHPRIVKYYGHRKEVENYYIFFEYVTGGELFNWIGYYNFLMIFIDPGSSMDNELSFRFSSQILEAIVFLFLILYYFRIIFIILE